MTAKPYIHQINGMSREEFVAAFGDVAENSGWVAERTETMRPFEDRNELIAAFAETVLAAEADLQLELLNAHPDLAGRAAVAGELGADSKAEQAGAGLDSLTPEEFNRFHALNADYRARFGFPFILAVRGAGKNEILSAFEERIDNDVATEFATALGHVCRIIRFRLEDRIAE